MPSVSSDGRAQLARRHEIPLALLDVAVVRDDVAQRRERQRQRMGGHLAHAVVRRVGDPHARLLARLGVDGVVTRADAAHDAELGQRRHDARGDRRVLQQDRPGSPWHAGSRRPRSCTARPPLRCRRVRTASARARCRCSRCRRRGSGACARPGKDEGGSTALERRKGTFDAAQRSSGLTGRAAPPIIPAPPSYPKACRGHHPANHHRRQPAQACLARRACTSCGRHGSSRATRSPRASRTRCASRSSTRSTRASTS